ncbi:MAG: alcohol dehydrogenase catalytic domain-containing protein [Ornithinimicrobium sp.]|uniref:alcohol dehydrogenase catalytic domain-containing protein n=1 Tax=Ornithinimicrobium sp. TaxID=1977084 RepID=UPI0026E07D2F|nr:alcohol dehydrogenase catalytic domain-containing protein [Ornithinimicrobium sp.]MDO5740051.1 alcohol dehydrogenase catalytic domain-containing protein [Ornithinimicrobium sp.]
MRFDAFGAMPYVEEIAIPTAPPGGIVIQVRATGLCRSDWHGWQGHDPDLSRFPHTPGHEFAGIVHGVGEGVEKVGVGDRVVVPFVCGCGRCGVCRAGNSHVCPHQWQPGFSGAGSFAEYVAIPTADFNVVQLPAAVSFEVAAGLGCRFATAYRGIVDVAKVRAGESVLVVGCGGVGLAAVMIASAKGARVVAVDVSPGALRLAEDVGAEVTISSAEAEVAATVEAVRAEFSDGVDVSVDALGSIATARAASLSLAVRGRHVQIGLLPEVSVLDRATIPMHTVIARELQVLGSHGMPAHDYPRMLADIASGQLRPERFLARAITLEEAPRALAAMSVGTAVGVTIIRP